MPVIRKPTTVLPNRSKYFEFVPLKPSTKQNLTSLGNYESDEIKLKLQEFQRTINSNLKVFRRNIKYPCQMSIQYLKNVIHPITPMEIFGCNHNFKKFIVIVQKLCTANIHENISYLKMLKGWRLNEIEWIKKAKNEKELLIHVIIWLINKVKNEVIRKLYFIQRSKSSYKVEFYPRCKYRSLKDKALNEMVLKKQLIPYKGKTPNFYSKLLLMPKNHMKSYRPVVLTKLLRHNRKQYILPSVRIKGSVFNRDLCSSWKNFVHMSGDRPVYGVKLDLKDAFSNVDIDTVIKLVKKILKENSSCRSEILSCLKGQVVQVDKGRYYIWNRGLMQGMRLSAKLCDIYRSFFDSVYLKCFITQNNFFHRTMDDYFFCSVHMEQVVRFREILEAHCLISTEKTQTNVDNINNEILYNGRIFDLANKEIKIHIDEDLETYRYKSKVYYRIPDFSGSFKHLFKIASLSINAYNFNVILLNLKYNSISTVLQNYFKAIATVALKVECAINERFTTVPKKLETFIIRVVNYYVKYVRKLLIKSKTDQGPMEIPRKVLEVIGIKAFILIFQKRYLPYKNVILFLKRTIVGYKHSLLGKSFNKLPNSFANIRMKRVLPQYK